MKETLYGIGEVAKLVNISIQTLRYYDQIGLFRPAFVDPKTNYRYYKDSQLYHLDLIKSLKYIGTPLEDIKRAQDLDTEEMLKFLGEQEKVIEEQLSHLVQIQQSISHVKERMQKRKDYPLFGEVLVQQTDEMRILQIPSENLTPYNVLNASYSELKRVVEGEEGFINNSYGAIFPYRQYRKIEDIEYSHIFTPVLTDKEIEVPSEQLEFVRIPAGKFISVASKYTGEKYFSNLQRLLKYIEKEKLQVAGDFYEFFLPSHYSPNLKEEYIVEISIRIAE